jgi:hypothetical protein
MQRKDTFYNKDVWGVDSCSLGQTGMLFERVDGDLRYFARWVLVNQCVLYVLDAICTRS